MDGPGTSDVIGDPHAVGAMAALARPHVVSWDEHGTSATAPLDELVPWWRSVAAAAGGTVDGGAAGGAVRVGRDRDGRARIVEAAVGGALLAAASREDAEGLDDALVPGGGLWSIAVAGPSGEQREFHVVLLLGDEPRVWGSTTATGSTMALVLDATDADPGTTVAVAVDDGEAASDRPVDAVLRVTGGVAVPVRRHVTSADLERRTEELMRELLAGVDADVLAGGAAEWLASFETAHRHATNDLTARGTAVAAAWGADLAPPSVVVVRLSPVGAAPDWSGHPGTRFEDVVRRRLFRPTVVDVRGRVPVAPVTAWTRSDRGDEPWRTLRGLRELPPLDDDAQGRVAQALVRLEELELDVVGAINRATAAAGRDTVAIVVAPDGRPAPRIDRWWPADVRPDDRRRLT
ncbi:hypothetical protein [Patulibacter minatonensis]|uniref:hypothetical protein n=1 Tax=Patulibacter minatonensis TaxID=298163 RepID=UPI000479D924|nr:hypothetical protein [Patulibacter minatonensis]